MKAEILILAAFAVASAQTTVVSSLDSSEYSYRLTNGMWEPLAPGLFDVTEGGTVWASSTEWASSASTIAATLCANIQIIDGKRISVTIDCHGVVTFGEGVTPTEAAKVFAEKVPKFWPQMCTNGGN